MIFYAGIGSRETPPDVLNLMAWLGRAFAVAGWGLRSGGAPGADFAFETGCDEVAGVKQIFVPWHGFNRRYRGAPGLHITDDAPDDVRRRAFATAETHHPAWGRCSVGAKSLHARNVFQVLGPSAGENPDKRSRLVICWTAGGRGGGGTGQAIRIARAFGVPIVDLGDPYYAPFSPRAILDEAQHLSLKENGR